MPESRIDMKAMKDANMSEHDIETIVEMGAKAKAYVWKAVMLCLFVKW